MAERDRDESGRARSARPREPLVGHFRRAVWVLHASRMTSSCPQPKPSPMPRTCWTGALAFNAHGVLEAARKNGPADERMLWQGLAQLAVGITHVQRGNVTGAITLLRRASARLAHDDRVAPYAIEALIDDLRADTKMTPKRPRPRLVASDS